LCGYWYFPAEVQLPLSVERGDGFSLDMSWLNRGVAPAYDRFILEFRFTHQETKESFEVAIDDADNRDWMPGVIIREDYPITAGLTVTPGLYQVAVRLRYNERPIELGMKNSQKSEDGFYQIAKLTIGE
jgi:hypothetical protein